MSWMVAATAAGAGAALVGLAALLVARGRPGRMPTGEAAAHPFCARCGHDLFGVAGRCPECGADLARRGATFIGPRPPRSGFLAAGAVAALAGVLLLTSSGWLYQREIDWERYKPLALLLRETCSVDEEVWRPAMREIERRVANGSLSQRSRQRILDAALAHRLTAGADRRWDEYLKEEVIAGRLTPEEREALFAHVTQILLYPPASVHVGAPLGMRARVAENVGFGPRLGPRPSMGELILRIQRGPRYLDGVQIYDGGGGGGRTLSSGILWTAFESIPPGVEGPFPREVTLERHDLISVTIGFGDDVPEVYAERRVSRVTFTLLPPEPEDALH